MAHVNAKNGVGDSWFAYWQNRHMPILEATKTTLQQMLRRADRIRPVDVAEAVMGDPLLVLQALRFIRSQQRSSLSADVVSIENIVMLMGIAPFLERFSHLPTVEGVLLPHSPAIYSAYLQEVYLARFTAKLAMLYADWRYDARIEEIAGAAILSRCNALLAMTGVKQDLHMPLPEGDECSLLRKLNIPEAVTELLGSAENAPPRVALQLAVVRLVNAFTQGWWQETVTQETDLITGILDVEPSSVWQALCKTTLALARDPARWPEVEQPARWLPMLPGAWPVPENVSAAQVNKEGAPPTRIKTDPLVERMQALHLSGGQGVAAKDIMALTVRALAEGLDMRRIVFSLLTPGQPELRARFVLGVPKEDPLRELVIRIDTQHLFTRLLEKPQSLWFNDGNAAQFDPHLPASFRKHFVSSQFCAMSVFVGAKPLGLIIADRNGAETLSEYHYQHFKQICLLTTKALTQSAGRAG